MEDRFEVGAHDVLEIEGGAARLQRNERRGEDRRDQQHDPGPVVNQFAQFLPDIGLLLRRRRDRSLVVANVIQNMITDTTAKIAIVHCQPRISLTSPNSFVPPRYFTRGRTNSADEQPPANAPTKRKLDATARVRDEELTTPSSDE